MKTTKKFISSIVAIALLTGVFSGSVYADNNQHKTTKTVSMNLMLLSQVCHLE